MSNGIHEGIVTEEEWKIAEEKRKETGKRHKKIYNIGRCHLLSGIVKCPQCGSGMYGNISRKWKKDKSLYKDHFYYACKHRRILDGHKCNYKKQWREEQINDAVVEIIRKLVTNHKFAEVIKTKIGMQVDTSNIDKELNDCKKRLQQLNVNKTMLENQIDGLAFDDRHYERKMRDLQNRLDGMYDKIADLEGYIEELEQRKRNVEMQMLSVEKVYKYLLNFDKLYDKFNDKKKAIFIQFS